MLAVCTNFYSMPPEIYIIRVILLLIYSIFKQVLCLCIKMFCSLPDNFLMFFSIAFISYIICEQIYYSDLLPSAFFSIQDLLPSVVYSYV